MEHAHPASVEPEKFSWKGGPGFRPIVLLIAVALFAVWLLLPAPQSMINMVTEEKPAGYIMSGKATTILENVSQALKKELTAEDVVFKAKVMVGLLLFAALLWGTEALALGATDLLVGVVMYLFFIMSPDAIAKAYAQDAVFFIFGVLAVAVGVSATGLDKRIGFLLLSKIKSMTAFCFIFFPSIAISASFLSEHALVALLVPVLLGVYKASCKANGVEKDKALAVFLLLGLCFAANHGGPGSPAAGGRNAIMVGYLEQFGAPISFLEWMKYGMPFVPVMAVCLGAFMLLVFRRKMKCKNINPSEIVKAEMARMGPFRGKQLIMGIILVVLVTLWIALGEEFGLGGPTIFAVVLMMIFRIVTWEDIQHKVHFDVVGLYAAACAMGKGLSLTGGALWMARSFVEALPDFMSHGTGIIIAVSLVTGTITNFMSDGATVAAVGPVMLPMAQLAGVHIWQVGLACAFSSSFANFLIVGTPNNAIAFAMGRDPETGERLLQATDFVKYGLPLLLIAWAVLWGWAVFGYWQLLDWPVIK